MTSISQTKNIKPSLASVVDNRLFGPSIHKLIPNWPSGLPLAQDTKVTLSLINPLHFKIKALTFSCASPHPWQDFPVQVSTYVLSSQWRLQTSPSSRRRLFWLHTYIYLFSIISCTSVKASRWYLRESIPLGNHTPRQCDWSKPRVLLTSSKQP